MTIAEFLTARLDEDEAVARKDIWCARRATAEGRWEAAYGYNLPSSELRAGGEVIGRLTAIRPGLADGEDAPHVADAGLVMRMAAAALPRAERALREVEADRKILALHPREEHLRPDLGPDWAAVYYCPCQCPDGIIEGEWPCETVRILAAVYSDHPDYDETWGQS
jgi:hypothetical protein